MRALSHIFSIMRGSVNGITYTANQFHQIIARAKTAPVDPSTTFQGMVRQAFSGAAVFWEGIAQASRDGWEDYASTLTYSNPLGNTEMPGRQVFMGNIGWMLYLLARGIVFTSQEKTPPLIPGFLSLDPVSTGILGAPGTGFSVNVGNPNSSDILVTARRSRPFTATRNTFKGPFNSNSLDTVVVVGESTGTIDFVGGVDGQVFFVEVRAIVDDGPKQVSQKVILRGVVSTVIA
jgi:hypothetical protein